jgi:hypothetical protein
MPFLSFPAVDLLALPTLRLPFSLRLRIRLTQLMDASYELVKALNT